VSDVLPTPSGDRPESARPGPAVPRPARPPEPTQVEGVIPDPTAAPSPQDPWAQSLEVFPGAPIPPQHRFRGRGVPAMVAAGVAAVLVGGTAIAWAAFNGDAGDQPERHLPTITGAFVKADFAPSAGQRIDAVRFLGKFPVGKDARGGGDPKQFVYERLEQVASYAPPWSEVEDWLGDRVALAAVPRDDGRPYPVAVLQVTDDAKARTTLDTSLRDDAVAQVADGWAIITDSRAHLDAVLAATAKGTLAQDATFRHDTEALGDSGVLVGWTDLSRLPATAALSPTLTPQLLTGPDRLPMRGAFVGRFTGGDAEVTVRTFGTPPPPAGTGAGAVAAALPTDAVAAFSVAGAGDAVEQNWSTLTRRLPDARATLASIEAQTGLRLPEDLAALLGQRTALALAEPDGSGRPVVGLRAQSDAAGLGPALDRFLRFTDASGLPLERRDVPGGYVLATDRAQAEALTRDGGLGGTDAFRDAVPDADRASVVAYVDVERVLATYGTGVDGDLTALRPLRAVGLAMTATDDGTTTTLRITTR
jgi:hypothetical protein